MLVTAYTATSSSTCCLPTDGLVRRKARNVPKLANTAARLVVDAIASYPWYKTEV